MLLAIGMSDCCHFLSRNQKGFYFDEHTQKHNLKKFLNLKQRNSETRRKSLIRLNIL